MRAGVDARPHEDSMAFAKGRQVQDEPPKAECLRRWPALQLKCFAVYYNGRKEGYVIERLSNGRRVSVTAERTAYEAWRTCLAVLEDSGF
jgi:hypothetical protein